MMYIAAISHASESYFADYYASDSINDIIEKTIDFIRENSIKGKITKVLNEDGEEIKVAEIQTGEYLLFTSEFADEAYSLYITTCDKFTQVR